MISEQIALKFGENGLFKSDGKTDSSSMSSETQVINLSTYSLADMITLLPFSVQKYLFWPALIVGQLSSVQYGRIVPVTFISLIEDVN